MSIEPAPWCVFVSGSRDLDWKHEPLIFEKLSPFASPGARVIHGMGDGRNPETPGCDRVADKVAQDLGFHIIALPALWEIQSRKAGPIRNRLCAEVLRAHQSAGFRLAFLGFSTGGPGTEGAHQIILKLVAKGACLVRIEKISVTL